jgi:hypothetical protein
VRRRSDDELERDLADWLEASAARMPAALQSAIEDMPARHEQVGRSRWFYRPRLRQAAVGVAASAAVVVAVVIGMNTLDDLRRATGDGTIRGSGATKVDDAAGAMVVDAVPFEWEGDLAQATSEEGEAFGCANQGAADRSIWFALTTPNAGTLRVTIRAGDLAEPESTTNATVFGPFQEPPEGPPGLADLRWCVNGVGEQYTLTEPVQSGLYLIQLSEVSTSGTLASIRIDFDVPEP